MNEKNSIEVTVMDNDEPSNQKPTQAWIFSPQFGEQIC